MTTDDSHIRRIADSIFRDHSYLFPSPYPDIPLNTTMVKDAMAADGIEPNEEDLPAIMDRIELELASMVPLNWNNYGTIAILLNRNYPDEDMTVISIPHITELVMGLPNFSDPEKPDEDTLNYIIYTWISLNDDYADFPEDEGWDF